MLEMEVLVSIMEVKALVVVVMWVGMDLIIGGRKVKMSMLKDLLDLVETHHYS